MEALGDWPLTIAAAAQQAARKWPTIPAIVDGDKVWTFTQLWSDVRAAASALSVQGLQSGDRVGLWAPNSREWIVAAIGAQSLGAAIVPLNTRYKGDEAGDILRRARCKLLFTVKGFLGTKYTALLRSQSLPDLQTTLFLEDFDELISTGDGENCSRAAAAIACLSPDAVSDILFTSGTTGAPKGALTTHRQVTQIFGDWARRVDLRHGDRYLIVNPFFHTFGYKGGWLACLLMGATIFPMATFDLKETIRQIEQNQISFFPGPPTIYQTLLAARDDGHKPNFSSLRVAVTGAAPVPPALVVRMREELGIQSVATAYGMTECGAISTTRQGDDPETIANTCGHPLPGIEIRCVDDSGRNLPAGQTGELLVRAPAVMKGYLDDRKATQEAIDADGWFHTGDVGTIDDRGYIRITDRKKDMYISGGFNCYPAEIENLLTAHPAIACAAVVAIADERLGEAGKAFIVLRANAIGDAKSIIDWARERIANYKIPREIAFVDELPRNASGKILRRLLRETARS